MKQISKITLYSFIFIFIYFIFYYTGIIKFLVLGSTEIFGDYKIFLNALNCYNLGISPYDGPQELKCKGFNYGHIILVITPFKNFLTGQYFLLLPIILIILFIITVIKLINPNNYYSNFLCILCLLNPSTLLLIERLNLDIILFLTIFILALNKLYFLNWFLIIYSFLFKFYPFIFGIIIFLEKQNRKLKELLFIFLFILSSSILFLFFFRDEYLLMLKDAKSWKMGLHYLFSIKTIPKVMKEAFSFNYALTMLLIYLSYIYLIYKNYSKFILTNDINISFQEKLYLLSTNTLLICFLVTSNPIYREVFIILTIPYILINKNQKIFNTLINIIIIKFIFSFIYIFFLNLDTFVHIDGLRVYKPAFLTITFIKGIIDYILMAIIGIITTKMNINILKKIIYEKKIHKKKQF